MANPVSWLLVEPGWRVVGTDGGELGSVEEVLGDENADIFHGLAVVGGIGSRARYVDAGLVDAIADDGTVAVQLDAAAFELLPEHGPD
ncbi:MAG TPA: hypothetical protein VF094_13040 [Gaiellaceae bacterium]